MVTYVGRNFIYYLELCQISTVETGKAGNVCMT